MNNETVDLGLSVNWCRCDLGAKSETEFGKYYQIGSTVGYYSGDGAEAHTRKDQVPKMKELHQEDSFVLLKEYDPVTSEFGDGYRMPTEDEVMELFGLENMWVENYKDSGLNGQLFIGKNKNTLFIPAAGYVHAGYVDGGVPYDGYLEFVNESGYILTTNISKRYDNSVRGLYFRNDGYISILSHFYFKGRQIRGIKEK